MSDRKTKFYHMDSENGRLRLGRVNLPIPQSRGGRIATGGLLVAGGCLGFLPVLGFWMVPLGLVVLSHDVSSVRRFRRRAGVKIGRMQKDGWTLRRKPGADAQ
ncbi:hypothetical protein [Allorhizobium taibaishanense]|uniref:Transmembrane protein n=2 Tax=Allorhizobium taibaishanense TaxID=887144 RepID=A0A7W6MU74_9HYPH|nr:hypothetical protein [Allorhizobium taibaishanense]MBB4007850.1 hypothetical protein [Allorhizobium taibaishanense]